MKKFTSLLIGVSLALAGAAFAQQPEEQASPKKEKPAAEKTQPAEPKTPKTRGANLASPEATASKQTGAMKEAGVTNEPGGRKGRRAKATETSATDNCECYPGNGGIGECSANSCGIGKCSANSCSNWPADRGRQGGGQGGSAEGATGQAAGAADQTAARELPRTAEAGQSSGSHVQRELSDSRKRSLARSAIRSIPIVSSGTPRSELVSFALPARRANRWRLLLLEQRLLVSGVGLRSWRRVLCLRCPDLCGSPC